MTNSLRFFRKEINSSSFLKDNFARYSILFWQVPPTPSTLDVSSYSFLSCKVSAEKYADSLMGGSFICDKSLFSYCFQISLILQNWQFDYNVSWCCLLWTDPVWDIFIFMNLDIHFPPNIWEVLAIISLNKLSSFSLSTPSGTPKSVSWFF